MAEAQRKNAKPKRRTNVTLPVMSVEIQLNTVFAQRVFNRVWDRLKGDIFTLTVRSRALGRDDIAEASETILKEHFERIRDDLSADITRADVLMDQVGITQLGRYDGAVSLSADYSTPQAKLYLDLVLSMDQLIMRMEALWLQGEIDTKSCKDRSYEWQRRLVKVANRIRQTGTSGKKKLDEAQEARNKVRNKGKVAAVADAEDSSNDAPAAVDSTDTPPAVAATV
ncbi:MAG: hypothetical protein ACR2PS_08725 [Pseudomonadales bacterium]